MKTLIGYTLMYKFRHEDSNYFCVDITKFESESIQNSLNGFIIRDENEANELLKKYRVKFSNIDFQLLEYSITKNL